MKSFEDLISENQLPTEDDLSSQEHQIELFGFQFHFVEGIMTTPDVILTMDIDEFMNFAKDHNVAEIIGMVLPYNKTDVFITRKLFEDNISDFTSVLITNYQVDLPETEQLKYVLNELDNSMENTDEYDIDNDKPILKLHNDYDNEDDLLAILGYLEYSYKLTSTAQKLLNEIIEYNNSIPEEFFKIPEKIQLGCIIDSVTYSIVVENTLSVDPVISLLEILSKYQSKYDNKIKEKLDKEKQIEYEQELKKQKQIDSKNDLIDKLLNNIEYLCLTNNDQRISFITKIATNEYNTIYYELFCTVYPEILLRSGYIHSSVRNLVNDIKVVAMKKGIKLGQKI